MTFFPEFKVAFFPANGSFKNSNKEFSSAFSYTLLYFAKMSSISMFAYMYTS